jgi:fatty-acyl-CoA synthase
VNESTQLIEGHLNIGRILRLGALKFGPRVFLEFGERAYTYADFNAQVNVLASAFAERGLANGDRVLILAPNSPGYVRAIFAAAKLGIVVMPVNAMLTTSDNAALIDLTRPALVVAGELYADRVREALRMSSHDAVPVVQLSLDERVVFPDSEIHLVNVAAGGSVGTAAEPTPARPVQDDDPALILFTSGSTGTPKGIVKSHRSAVWSAINHQISEPRRSGDRESFCLSLAGIAFANFLMLDVLAGATCVLEPAFNASALTRTLSSRGITHIFIAPTMVAAIARAHPHARFPSVRVVETSFEFPIALREQTVAMFPNAAVLWSFGSSEATMARTPPHYLLTDVSCVGYAGGLDEYRIDPETTDGVGEVQSFGPTVMQGYLTSVDGEIASGVGIRPDGWFPSGDLGWIDDDGALHFAGRVKDMIKSGGANVFAGDVETVLVDHPDVRNAAVIGLPDDYWGEVVCAVLESDALPDLLVASVREFVSTRLAGYRQPKRYFVMADLPKNPTGKIAKGTLKASAQGGELKAVPIGPADASGSVAAHPEGESGGATVATGSPS